MSKTNVFCFGFGQVAKSFIKKLDFEKIQINLTTTSREKTQKKTIGKINYSSLQFTKDKYDPALLNALKKSNYILVSIPPAEKTDIVIKNLKEIINNDNNKLKWITYLSATSVYGDHKGKWVNEASEKRPTSNNGKNRLSAENDWIKLAKKKKLPIQIFRLSGIYSNQRNILTRLKSGEVNIIKKKKHYFSRIHVEDIANILFKSMSKFKSTEIYNISDDKPASSKDVTLYGVKLLNIEKPKTVEIKEIKGKMLKDFYKDSKKVNNKKMKEFFNYKLKYSTYVEGLNHIFNNAI